MLPVRRFRRMSSASPAVLVVSDSDASSKARMPVSASLTKYSATPSPATPSATNVQPTRPIAAIHFRGRSFLESNSGQSLSQPFRSSIFWTALRPKLIACQTSGASQMMPITTAIVEPTRIQNHKFDHASKSTRIDLSSWLVSSGGSAEANNRNIDRNDFLLSFLEVAGSIYVIDSALCKWEFTIGIKESIKNLSNSQI